MLGPRSVLWAWFLDPAHCDAPCAQVRLLPARRGAEQLLWWRGAFSSFLWWWGPETANVQPSLALAWELAPWSRISEEASQALMREDQSRWQETEVIPVAVVQTA